MGQRARPSRPTAANRPKGDSDPLTVQYQLMQSVVHSDPLTVQYQLIQSVVHSDPLTVQYQLMQSVVHSDPLTVQYQLMQSVTHFHCYCIVSPVCKVGSSSFWTRIITPLDGRVSPQGWAAGGSTAREEYQHGQPPSSVNHCLIGPRCPRASSPFPPTPPTSLDSSGYVHIIVLTGIHVQEGLSYTCIHSLV